MAISEAFRAACRLFQQGRKRIAYEHGDSVVINGGSDLKAGHEYFIVSGDTDVPDELSDHEVMRVIDIADLEDPGPEVR